MKKTIARSIIFLCLLVLFAWSLPIRSEPIDMSKIPEQYGMKEAPHGRAWMDNPQQYAAAQQINQTEVSKHSATYLVYYLCGAVFLGWLIFKIRKFRG